LITSKNWADTRSPGDKIGIALPICNFTHRIVGGRFHSGKTDEDSPVTEDSYTSGLEVTKCGDYPSLYVTASVAGGEGVSSTALCFGWDSHDGRDRLRVIHGGSRLAVCLKRHRLAKENQYSRNKPISQTRNKQRTTQQETINSQILHIL
jgi:hypothetical protein